MADDPHRDLLPVKECPFYASKGSLGANSCDEPNNRQPSMYYSPRDDAKHHIKLSRSDLEDRYLKICEENTALKKHGNNQDEKTKRLATKFMRLRNEHKRAMRTGEERRDYQTAEQIDDHLIRIADLERANRQLMDRVLVLKNQLATHSRVHSGVHQRSPSRSPRRVNQGSNNVINQYADEMSEQASANKMAEMAALRNQINSLQQEMSLLREQNAARVAALEGELALSWAEDRRGKTAENVELIRLRRELRQQAGQLEAFAARNAEVENDVVRMIQVLQDSQREKEMLFEQLSQERLQSAAKKTDLEPDFMEQYDQEVSDMKKEIQTLKEHNQNLLRHIAQQSLENKEEQKKLTDTISSRSSEPSQEDIRTNSKPLRIETILTYQSTVTHNPKKAARVVSDNTIEDNSRKRQNVESKEDDSDDDLQFRKPSLISTGRDDEMMKFILTSAEKIHGPSPHARRENLGEDDPMQDKNHPPKIKEHTRKKEEGSKESIASNSSFHELLTTIGNQRQQDGENIVGTETSVSTTNSSSIGNNSLPGTSNNSLAKDSTRSAQKRKKSSSVQPATTSSKESLTMGSKESLTTDADETRKNLKSNMILRDHGSSSMETSDIMIPTTALSDPTPASMPLSDNVPPSTASSDLTPAPAVLSDLTPAPAVLSDLTLQPMKRSVDTRVPEYQSKGVSFKITPDSEVLPVVIQQVTRLEDLLRREQKMQEGIKAALKDERHKVSALTESHQALQSKMENLQEEHKAMEQQMMILLQSGHASRSKNVPSTPNGDRIPSLYQSYQVIRPLVDKTSSFESLNRQLKEPQTVPGGSNNPSNTSMYNSKSSSMIKEPSPYYTFPKDGTFPPSSTPYNHPPTSQPPAIHPSYVTPSGGQRDKAVGTSDIDDEVVMNGQRSIGTTTSFERLYSQRSLVIMQPAQRTETQPASEFLPVNLDRPVTPRVPPTPPGKMSPAHDRESEDKKPERSPSRKSKARSAKAMEMQRELETTREMLRVQCILNAEFQQELAALRYLSTHTIEQPPKPNTEQQEYRVTLADVAPEMKRVTVIPVPAPRTIDVPPGRALSPAPLTSVIDQEYRVTLADGAPEMKRVTVIPVPAPRTIDVPPVVTVLPAAAVVETPPVPEPIIDIEDTLQDEQDVLALGTLISPMPVMEIETEEEEDDIYESKRVGARTSLVEKGQPVEESETETGFYPESSKTDMETEETETEPEEKDTEPEEKIQEKPRSDSVRASKTLHKHDIRVDIHSLQLEKSELERLKNVVHQVYVEYKFLGMSGVELETPSEPLNQLMTFNYTKTFNCTGHEKRTRLNAMAKAATWQLAVLQFTVISEPVMEEAEIADCEEIGFVEVDMRDVLSQQKDLVEYNAPVYSSDGKKNTMGTLTLSILGIQDFIPSN